MDAPFATADALRTYLKQPTLDETAAGEALAAATGFIRAAAEQWISFVAGDVETAEVRYGADLFVLSQFPVVALTSVEVYADSTATWSMLDPSVYRWARSGVVRRSGCGRWPSGQVRVTYDHGYEVIDESTPPGLWGVCVSMAARRTVNPRERVMVRLGGFQETVNPGPGLLATPAEQTVINRYRSPVSG